MNTVKNFPLIKRITKDIHLHTEIDTYDNIHKSIEAELQFKGSNFWILVFAIIIASVGLNMNSTAVVIGAMLISPLMGPINGMGYSIATYNFPLLQRSVRNFTFSVLASILASAAYFSISPISTAHSEILARTSPTIYDVLIALFGGLAGIMAISSKKKGNVIPGVAIATALMPPLCTAGYGLATGQFNYLFGAIYLFTINTVFIGIASLVISQILNFPIRKEINEKLKKQINHIITAVIFLVLIPSIYLGYKLVLKEEFMDHAKKFVASVSVLEENYLLKSEISPQTNTILLVYGGSPLTPRQKEHIRSEARFYSLEDVSLDLHDGFAFDVITERTSELETTKAELNRLSLLLKEKNKVLDSIDRRNRTGQQILMEAKTFFPEIVATSYGISYIAGDTSSQKLEEVIVFRVKGNTLSASEKRKLESWLKARQKTKNVRIFYEYQ